MRKRSVQRLGWLFAAASGLLHLASYVLLRATPPLPSSAPDTTIEFSLTSQPAAPEPAAVEPVPPLTVTEAPPPPARRERVTVAQPRRARERETEAHDPPVAVDAPAPARPDAVAEAAPSAPAVPVAPTPSTAPRAPSTLDLSPRRAASTMLEAPRELARACSPNPGVASAPACEPPDRGDVEVAQRKLNQWLQSAANEPEYRRKREAPELRRQGDGSYRYDGHLFAAQIQPDGRVQFRDRGDATIDGPATIGPGVMGSFDFSDAVEHGVLGKERHSAEKRWFLEQTASLREKLTEAARAEESLLARRALASALERILAAAELAPSQKRQQILELWENCGDDADSREARRKVEEFVKARMPEGTPLGFSPEELERFNRGRARMAAFVPYRKG